MQVENFQKLMDTVAQIDEQGRKAVKATVVLAEGFEGSSELTRELQTWV